MDEETRLAIMYRSEVAELTRRAQMLRADAAMATARASGCENQISFIEGLIQTLEGNASLQTTAA